MLFRKLANQKEELETYKRITRRYEILVNEIINKCEECRQIQWLRNPNIGFNVIEEFAKSEMEEIFKIEDNLFLTNDD